MLNQNQIGMRCRATREIRTHEGLIRRFTEGTIQVSLITWGVNLLMFDGTMVLARTYFSMRLKSRMDWNFLPRSSNRRASLSLPPSFLFLTLWQSI